MVNVRCLCTLTFLCLKSMQIRVVCSFRQWKFSSKIKIQVCHWPTTLCNQRIFNHPGIFISYMIWGMPWCGIIQPNREMPLRLRCWMCISSNCGTAVDVVGPICQGPTKTPMGVQHPNEEPEGTYIPSQRAVEERIWLGIRSYMEGADGGVRQGLREIVGRDPLGDESRRSWKKKADFWADVWTPTCSPKGWRKDLEDSLRAGYWKTLQKDHEKKTPQRWMDGQMQDLNL